jgi:hypothetical protein
MLDPSAMVPPKRERSPVLNPVKLSEPDIQHVASLLNSIPLDLRLNGDLLPSSAPPIILTAQVSSEPLPTVPVKPQPVRAQPVAFSIPKPAPQPQKQTKPVPQPQKQTKPAAETQNLDAWLDDLLS